MIEKITVRFYEVEFGFCTSEWSRDFTSREDADAEIKSLQQQYNYIEGQDFEPSYYMFGTTT